MITGLYWVFRAPPAGWGRSVKFITTYNPPPLQLVPQYQLDHNAGALVREGIQDFDTDRLYWNFPRALPTNIGYNLLPGWSMDVWWLQICP